MTERPLQLPPGYRLICFDAIGSTNDEAKRLARKGAAERTVIWALEQSAGRGRRGRRWVSPRGNLYASLILRPDCAPNRAAQLGFVAALAVGGAVGALLPQPDRVFYKWPNDVLINGRKIAGILLESEMFSLERLSFLVVGVGVNLRTSPSGVELPASSVAQEGFGLISPAVMLEAFAGQFQFWETRWRSDGFAPVRAAWLEANATSRGEPVSVRMEAGSWDGRFLDLDEEGALVLDAAGQRRRVSAGEVFPTVH